MTNLFKPKTPAVQAPAEMPDSESPAVQDARRRQRAGAMSGTGKAATLLQDWGSAKLGGGA
jgi:hypothetical protein